MSVGNSVELEHNVYDQTIKFKCKHITFVTCYIIWSYKVHNFKNNIFLYLLKIRIQYYVQHF